PYSDAIIGYKGEYDRLDFYLGKMIEIYASLSTVSVAGGNGVVPYTERTLFGVVSDHGLVYTPRLVSIEEQFFKPLERDDPKKKIERWKLSADEGGLPVIHGRDGFTRTRPLDAIMGSTAGGSYVIDLFSFSGLQGNDEAWKRHPGFHDLLKHKLLDGTVVNWIQEMNTRLKGIVDVALVREYGPAPGAQWPKDVESVVRIFTPDRGDARIYRIRKADVASGGADFLYRYELIDEDRDPLGLVDAVRDYLIPSHGPSKEKVQESLRECIQSRTGCPGKKWSELLSYTLRPDVIHQFSQLYDSDRAGTINVFPVRHVGMNTRVPGRHAGESFGEKNATMLFFGAGLKRASVQTARNGSLPVTLYHWFVGDKTFFAPESRLSISPADQFGYPTLLNEPAFAPITGHETP
ncbi:MAG: hypothetical protein O7J95_13275, partial [Planctomycetota bacterium]|nr:hypothetical protein [Planctomycetota bacterium]